MNIAVLVLLAAAAPARAGVRLVSADAVSTVIEYRSGEPSFSPVDGGYEIVSMDQARVYGQPGEPGLLECPVHVAVPQGSRVRVDVLAAESRDYPDITVAPVPSLAPDQSGLGTESFLADAGKYAAAGFLPSELAGLGTVEPLRQLTVARVSLRPMQYAPAAGTVRAFSLLRVRVSWSGGRPGAAALGDRGFQTVLEQSVINYAEARTWGKREEPAAARDGDPFDAAPLWFKLAVARDAIYRLTYTDLKLNGINPDAIDPATIKLFTGGSRAFPKDETVSYADSMYQVALRVEGGDDGAFGPDDYLLFYGQGMNGWDRNARLPLRQYNNPYDSVNCYWLCWGGAPGLRMAVRDGEPSDSGAPVPAAFTDTIHLEEDHINPFNSGEPWFWQNLTRSNYEQTRRYRVPFIIPAVAGGQGQARVSLLPAALVNNHHLRWGFNGDTGNDLDWYGSPASGDTVAAAAVTGLVSGNNMLELELVKQGADSSDAVLLDWAEVAYRRPYQAHNRQLRFRADGSYVGTVRFHVTGLASDRAVVLDISDPDRPQWIATTRRYPAYTEFQDQPSGRRYVAAAPEAWLTPQSVQPYQPQRLRQAMLGSTYLIVAADAFWPQAQALLAYHAGQADRQPARAVKLSAVYNEFGFGLKDPSAVRNFLKHVYLRSAPARTSPTWCCLLGDGSYDYRRIDRSVPDQDLVPSHQDDILHNDGIGAGTYLFSADDDWFGRIESLTHPQFAIGRIPAKDAAEAWTAVNKALGYNRRQGLGPWRNRVLLMADDAFERTEYHATDLAHTSQAESIARSYLPASYDVAKVYGEMYPLSSQLTKPAATGDLLRHWNQGAGIVHFIGHGAWWVWGHESYFRYTDVPSLANGDRLPLVMMCSCGTSRFDDPRNESIGSSLVVKQGGGAVATIGAMRETYGGDNFTLSTQFYHALFTSPTRDIGLAFYHAKLTAGGGLNRTFVLLGDPGLSYLGPAGQVQLAADADTLFSRGRYTAAGTVSGAGPGIAQVQVTLNDVPQRDSTNPYPGVYCKFIRPGRALFQGLAPAAGDSFRASFNVPDLLHADPVSGARISAYAWGGAADAAGAAAGPLWIGSDPDTAQVHGDTTDHSGPAIAVTANGLALEQGDTIDARVALTIRAVDRSGINIAPGATEGEVRLRIDRGDPSDLSQRFVYESGSDSSGAAAVDTLISSGTHTVRIEAYDCRLNKTTWERTVTVAATALRVESLFNYPNPFRDRTWFTFQIRQAADVTIKVFTVAGRLIRTIEAPGLAPGYNQVRWDGLDGDGDALANGVYLYKVVMKSGAGETSAFGKLTVLR
ncbi:MAG: type IX secretion system sortase PorU [Candidatus Edwardsbacteria bacterium]|nr:type IX secretion system sortase PorU [Candidatus Edwardsbacteria bacterium]